MLLWVVLRLSELGGLRLREDCRVFNKFCSRSDTSILSSPLPHSPIPLLVHLLKKLLIVVILTCLAATFLPLTCRLLLALISLRLQYGCTCLIDLLSLCLLVVVSM